MFVGKMLGFFFFTNLCTYNDEKVPPSYKTTSYIPPTVKCLPLSQIPEPMYTEGDVKALKQQHAEEIQLLQEEYE